MQKLLPNPSVLGLGHHQHFYLSFYLHHVKGLTWGYRLLQLLGILYIYKDSKSFTFQYTALQTDKY